MSASIKRKNTQKEISIVVGEKTIKTNCKTFGIPLKNDSGEFVSKCIQCNKKNADVSLACSEKHLIDNPVIVAKTATKTSSRPWAFVVENLLKNTDRKTIISLCENNFGMKTTSAKSFVSSCGCVVSALNGKSKKKDGVVNKYCEYLLNDKKGNAPTGDKNSISYVKTVFTTMIKLNEKAIEV